MAKVYRNQKAVLNAAQKALGGRVISYDGTPTLAIDRRNEDDQIVTTYLNADEAARKAGLDYRPADPLAEAYDPDDELDFVHLKGALKL